MLWALLTIIAVCADLVTSLKIRSIEVPKYAKVRIDGCMYGTIVILQHDLGLKWQTQLQN